jgi:hypothetical protein
MPNVEESVPWQLLGAVDGTQLRRLGSARVVASRRLELGEGKVFEEGGLRSWGRAEAGRRVLPGPFLMTAYISI